MLSSPLLNIPGPREKQPEILSLEVFPSDISFLSYTHLHTAPTHRGKKLRREA